MNARLRKRHRLIWSLLAPILLLVLILAWMVRPKQVSGDIKAYPVPSPVGDILVEAQQAGIKCNLRGKGKVEQLEVFVLSPLKVPSALISFKSGEGRKVLGLVGRQGISRFPVSTLGDAPEVLLLDRLRRDTICQIRFKSSQFWD